MRFQAEGRANSSDRPSFCEYERFRILNRVVLPGAYVIGEALRHDAFEVHLADQLEKPSALAGHPVGEGGSSGRAPLAKWRVLRGG